MKPHHSKVFISRDLAEESIFRQRLSAKGYAVIGQSLIEFSPLPFGSIPATDWIFFYSRNGVHFFLTQCPPDFTWPKLAAIGPGTAKALHQNGLTTAFIGSGDPASTAQAFGSMAQGQSVLFVQAQQSRQSVERLLASVVTGLSFPVYQNQAKLALDIPHCEILVFTSPMNVAAYFAQYSLQQGQQIVAIGTSTAQALADKQLDYLVSAYPDEAHLAEAVLQLGE